MTVKFKGVHGTCAQNAKSILQNGALGSPGLIGTGFYLWPYLGDGKRAYELARDWYQYRRRNGAYDSYPENGKEMAILVCEIDVDPHSYVNLNSARHHERLNEIQALLGSEATLADIYDEYMESQSQFRKKQYGAELKIVEATVPLPPLTKVSDRAKPGTPLTQGTFAYNVQTEGLRELVITPWQPKDLRS